MSKRSLVNACFIVPFCIKMYFTLTISTDWLFFSRDSYGFGEKFIPVFMSNYDTCQKGLVIFFLMYYVVPVRIKLSIL